MKLPSSTPATRFMHGFWQLRQTFIGRVSPALRDEVGLEVSEVFLLEYVAKSDLSPSEIAAQLRMPAHAISRRLDGLEKGGLLTRSLDPADARRRVLRLTTQGKHRYEAAAKRLEREVTALLSALDHETLELMLAAMARITQSAHTLNAVPNMLPNTKEDNRDPI